MQFEDVVVAQAIIDHIRTDEAVERVARLACLEPGEEWPSNEALGGNLTGTRDHEYRDGMRDQAREAIDALNLGRNPTRRYERWWFRLWLNARTYHWPPRAAIIEWPYLAVVHILAGVGRGMAWVVGQWPRPGRAGDRHPRVGRGVGHAGRGR